MPTIADAVGMARSQMNASLAAEFTLLDEDWNPGDPTLTLRDQAQLQRGSVICAGLTTFSVLDPGKQATVVAGIDGSPTDTVIPRNTPVLLRPRHTTWQVFSEVAATVAELSSPVSGLFAHTVETHPADTIDATYELTKQALRVLRVRYLRPGSSDDWVDLPWSYQPGSSTGPVVRAMGAAGGSTVEIQYASMFEEPTALDDTLTSLGMPDHYTRILAVGAARNLSLSSEARRAQPFSQGDPRRAEEVPMGNNAMIYDRLRRLFRDLVADERARLVSLWPYRFQTEVRR